MSVIQVAEELNDKPMNISKKIRLLLEHNEIKCIELDRFQAAKLLNWEIPIRRTRFYYIEIKLEDIKEWSG